MRVRIGENIKIYNEILSMINCSTSSTMCCHVSCMDCLLYFKDRCLPMKIGSIIYYSNIDISYKLKKSNEG